MRTYRNSKGQFARIPLGAVVLMLDNSTNCMDEVYYVIIGVKGRNLATIPYTYEPTHLHQRNFKVKNFEDLEIYKQLALSDIAELISKIKVSIQHSPIDCAYKGVARHAISQLELISR